MTIRNLFRLSLTWTLIAWAHGAWAQVYVSNEKSNAIFVYDAKGQKTGQIAVCKRPRHMMLSSDKKTIYVCCGDSNALGIVDRAAQKMTDTVPLGDSPELFDLSADGKTLYVTIEDENVLAAYDLGKKTKVFDIKTGGEPEGVLLAPDGKSAYVTSEVANTVHVIDLVAKKIVKNIKVGNRPRRFVLSPDGSELWVTNELGSSVSVVNTATHEVKNTIAFKLKGIRDTDITPVGMVRTAKGDSVWVGLGRANHVAEVDAKTKAVKRTVLVGKRAWGLALSKDEGTLYVANGLSDDMTLVETASGKALRTVPAGRVPHTVLVVD
jgi:PQQ-dependent catabolism-associated beta-propeller protein